MQNWEIEALKLKKDGMPLREIMKLHNPLGLGYETFQRRLWRVSHPGDKKIQEETNPNLKKPISLLELLKTQSDINTLMDKTNKSKRVIEAEIEDLKEQGYQITECNGIYEICKQPLTKENKHNEPWKGNKIIRFGLCGDNQSSSKWTQWTHLHNFYDRLAAEGIETVYHTGDIDEGEEMRIGHKYECYKQGADDHVAEIVKNYPKREGMVTKFISGNHDHSMIKRCGLDIGNSISEKRQDMIYLGQSSTIVNLTPNCTLELRHPLDGTAYSLSYKLQKMIEAMSGGEKPNILAVGHYHKAEYLIYRNIHAIQTGCFQAQTNWERGKQIAVTLGGWICEVEVNQEGEILSFTPKFIPYYKAIPDDYKNWL